MPIEGNYDIDAEWCHERCRRRTKKLKYWMDKGCTKRKAEELLYRYGY